MNMKVIRDCECSRDMPLLYGFIDSPVYGSRTSIPPRYPGNQDTPYAQKIYLPELLPLEAYDLVVVLFSGGKDSSAAYYKLLELGVPKPKIELWHHDIDGGHPTRRMDWPVTQSYVRAFAEAEGVRLRVSYRVNGFWGEVYRIGASFPIEYEDDGSIKTCRLSAKQYESEWLREQIQQELGLEEYVRLKSYGFRMKFPAKSGDLSRRWCSAYLKIDVADAVLRNLEALWANGRRGKFPAKFGCHQGRWCSGTLKAEVQSCVTSNLETTRQNINILIVSGERRGESTGRAGYNEMEIHRTNATIRAHRLVHQWRNVIDYTEKDVWEVLKRHHTTPHPCYACGWNRCSCMMCIFSLPQHWAGIRELFPEEYEAVRQNEIRLGFTLDNKKALDEYVGNVESCVIHTDRKALHQLVTGEFTAGDIYQTKEWSYPAGAFKGSEGGPC